MDKRFHIIFINTSRDGPYHYIKIEREDIDNALVEFRRHLEYGGSIKILYNELLKLVENYDYMRKIDRKKTFRKLFGGKYGG